MNYVYALPFFKTSSNRLASNALGGWQISGITSFFTGTPLNPGFACDVTGFGTGIGSGMQCNSLAPVKIQKGVDNDPSSGPRPPGLMGTPSLIRLNHSFAPMASRGCSVIWAATR